MEYNWDKKKIAALKKQYIYLKRKTEGLTKQDKDAIQKKLSYIKELEDIVSPSIDFSYSRKPQYMDKKTKFLPKSTWNDYQKVPSFIRKWIINTMHVVRLYKMPNNQSIPIFPLKDDELVELSHDFFNWLPNKIYVQLAHKYLDKNENLLRIQKNTYNNSHYFGQIYPFTYPIYTPYFLVNRNQNINDFCTLNHEIAHGIFYATDSNISTSNNHQYLSELEGYFFDFLSLEFLKEKRIVSPEIIKKLAINELICLQQEFLIPFYFQYLSISIYQKAHSIELEEVYRKLLEQQMPFEIWEDFLILYLSENSKKIAKYAISSLTSTDLEKMFLQDRELAFHNFEKIRYNKTDNIEKNLTEHGITFMFDKYQNLQEKMQRLSLQKK